MRNKPIIVDYTSFALPNVFTEEYGNYKILEEGDSSFNPTSFTLNDIAFVSTDKIEVSGLAFKKEVEKNNHIPLDGYAAQALFRDKELLREIRSLWWDERGSLHSNRDLKTLSFLGSIATWSGNKKTTPHIISLEFNTYEPRVIPQFVVFEAEDIGWSKGKDWAAVFKKTFVEKMKR